MTPARPTRPPLILPHFTRSILGRSLSVWAAMRAVMTATLSAAAPVRATEPANPLRIPLVAVLLVLGVVCVVGWVSSRRRNEDTFLLCLGYGRARQMALIVVPAAVLELVLWVAG